MPNGWKPCKRVLLKCPVCGNRFSMTTARLAERRRLNKREDGRVTCSVRCGALARGKERRRALFFMALALLFFAASVNASLVPIQILAPCTNADSLTDQFNWCSARGGTTLSGLSSIQVWAQPCGRTDSTLIGTIPALGMECDTINADLDMVSGHTYWLWTRVLKTNGMMSQCRGPQLTIAVPLAEFEPGLWGEYYGAMDFTHFAYTRADAQIDFAWGELGPGVPMPTTEYSVRWTGKIRAPTTGLYRFRVRVKDGERLNVAGVQVTDNWIYAYAHDDVGTVSLTGGFSYPLTLEYLSHWGGSEVHLFWTKPGATEELVPANALEQP